MQKNTYKLTYPQQNIMFVERFNKNSSINVITGLFNVKKDFNEKSCEKAINDVIKNNVAMRTRVTEENGEFSQYFCDYIYEEIEVVDMSSFSKDKILEYIDGIASQSLFALNSKLYSFKILKYSKDSGSILMSVHHIISDAWSCSKIGDQLLNTIENYNLKVEEELEEQPSYIEYINSEFEYKNSEKYIKDEEFWKEYLNGLEETISLKDKTTQISNSAKRYSVKLDKDFNDKVLEYCKENRISPYALFLAAISTYLYRVKDKNDFVLGSPVLNRSNFKEKKMLGMFVSTLPLRIKIEENENFLELAKKIGKDTLSVFRHQKYPYMKTLENVRKDSNIKSNLYNIVLSYQNARTDIVNEEKYSTGWAFSKALEDELQIHIMDMDDTGILNINYDYKTELFEKIEIEYLHTRLLAIIQNAIEDKDVNVENIRIMSKEEEHKILYEFNDTYKEYPQDKTVIQLFEEQVKKTPNNVALVFENETMTYKELNEKANSLAHYLREEKNINNKIVGIKTEKNINTIILILSMMKNKCTFVPIDDNLPVDRKKSIVDQLKLETIIYFQENEIKIDYTEYLNNNEIIYEDLYIVFTSGSTGIPKGVRISNKNIVNLLYSQSDIEFKKNNVLQFATLNFDVSYQEIFSTLCNGSSLFIISEEEKKDIYYLVNYIRNNNINILFIPPAYLRLICEQEAFIIDLKKSLRFIITAGEQLVLTKGIKKLLNSNIKLFNHYGPAETHVVTSYLINNEDILKENNLKVPIGKAINNNIIVIEDKKGRALPIGCLGEIAVYGDSVGNGYYNNDELTEEKFVEKHIRGSFLKGYKTGDLGEYKNSGNIIFYGRNDFQYKINGYRVEIEEVERKLFELEYVRNAVILVKKINSARKICAIIELTIPISIERIRSDLQNKLPSYMMPTIYHIVDKINLNKNGKIDRNIIKNIDLYNEENEQNLAQNFVQETISDILKNIFDYKNIYLKTNLNEIGFDSLNAIKLTVELNQKFNLDMKVKEIFECKNILDIEKMIYMSKNAIEFNKNKVFKEYPLSSAQFGIFTNYSLNPDSLAYNIPFEMKFSKNIDIDRLRKALVSVINSTDTFFTKIQMRNGELYQSIDKNIGYHINVFKVLENEYERKRQNCIKAFDLLNDVLFNIDIFETEKNVYVVANIHHIIFDGLSMNIFLDKLKTAYEIGSVTQDEISFGQFALYERNIKESEKYKEAREYFNNMFLNELPDNNMVLDKKRKKEKSFNGNKLTLKLDKKYSDDIKKFADKNKVTLNSVFLSMFNLVLSKYMYSHDIVIGMATSGRTLKEEVDKIGMFVKTVPFRTKLNFEDNILDYIENTQKRVIESIDNSIYTYEDLVKDLDLPRNISRNPLFDIMFVYQNTGMPNIKFNDEKVELSALTSNTTKFDITCEVMPNNEEFDINIEYSTDLFYEETIKRFAKHYINAIKAILENKNNCIKDIDILSREEKDIILNEYNNTKTDYPKEKSVVEIFKEQSKLTPNNIAVVFEGNTLTYKELDEKSDKLAYYLYKNGVKKGDMIAIMMDKSLELMISILAILKSGAAYVPIELDFPNARIEYILKDTKAKKILINSEEIKEKVKDYDLVNVNLASDLYAKEVNMNVVKTDKNDLVYVMYTSGTTGNPKGVMVNNQNVVRLVKNTNYISFEKGDKIIQTGAISFDASTFEFFGTLLNGLELHLVRKEQLLSLPNLEKYVKENGIKIMWLTSKLFNNVIEYSVDFFKSLRCLLVGGDVLSTKHINSLKKNNYNIQIINGYGPTENTTFSACHDIKELYNSSIPIGKPISNTTCYVLDKTGKLCYNHMLGELVVGGDGVANGYLNNHEMTTQKFIPDTFLNKNDSKMYKTGDLVYLDKEGNINFCGRIDTQVKIRGFRIEPDEINQQLLNYEDIKESVVIVENHNGKKVIVAYYTSDVKISKIKIVNYLKEFLPQYMIPTYFVNITKIPLNNNGKADKNKLFELGQEIIKNTQNKANTEVHYEGEYLKVYELFREVLNIDNISYDDDFFEIGGDSLLALKLVTNAIAKDIQVTYPDLFKHPTIKELGDMLNKTLNEKSICEPMYTFDYSNVNKVLKNNVYTDSIKYDNSIGNVLLTGVTGFLGAHILDEFMKSEKGKIYCIIRNKNGKDAEERLKEILNFFFGKKYDNEIGKRIFVIEGDIAGVNKFKIESRIIKDIDTVINSAACVKHFGEYELFEKINVNLVKDLIDFCVEYDKKLIQISTLSVSGNLLESGQLDQTNVKPNTVFNENNLYIEQNLDNVYAYTKYLAEKLVYDAIGTRKLKGKIMRMGNLTGRTDDGKFQPNVSENAFANRLKTMLELNVLPTNMLDFYLEFTPINYAAKAVILLSKTEDKYNTYHLFNHNHAMLYFVDSVLNGDLDIHLNHITKEEMTKIIETYSKQKDGFDKIKGIVLDVNKNKELEYVSNIIVKSDFTIKVLEKLGFKWPKITKDYINKYLGYLFDIGFLTKEGK